MKNEKLPSIFIALENIDGISVKDYSRSGIPSLWGTSIFLNGKEIFRIHETEEMCKIYNITEKVRIELPIDTAIIYVKNQLNRVTGNNIQNQEFIDFFTEVMEEIEKSMEGLENSIQGWNRITF